MSAPTTYVPSEEWPHGYKFCLFGADVTASIFQLEPARTKLYGKRALSSQARDIRLVEYDAEWF